MTDKLELTAAAAGLEDIDVVALLLVVKQAAEAGKPKELRLLMSRKMAATLVAQLAKALQ